MPRASSLAAEIKQAFGVESELVEGANGIFDVVVDGATVFSKHAEQRFPEPGEIVDALRAMSAA
ncbi:MAG: Rdx family protein [Acidobacteria bacterium]|nr:Rdx family protein [Acidobacteriota bacterium]